MKDLLSIKSNLKKTLFISLILIILISLAYTDDSGDVYEEDDYTWYHQEIYEQDIWEGQSLGNKQYAYYQMQISQRYFNGTQNLAIKVLPESFDSDPDLFISKNVTNPTSTLDSQWFCTKKGGDTCVIKKSEISQGDTLYIGVRCLNPCKYSISSSYFTTTLISENTRTQVRLEGYSSNLFSYYVPTDASDGFTSAVTMTIESEDAYNPIDLYFSLDDTIYQVDERKVENIMSNGVGFYFTDGDYGWCTRCYIYFFANVINDGRYYVTIKASARNPIITINKSYDKFVNIRQQDCFQYYVTGQDNDVMISLSQYQGNVDLYIGGSTNPSGPTDTGIVIKSERGAQRNLILTAEDRIRKGYRTGLYEVCIYGLDESSSVQITPTEANYAQRIDATDQNVYTFNLEKKYYMYFRYTSQYFSSASNITVKIQSYSLTTGQVPPKIFYRVCSSTDSTYCFLNDTEAAGSTSNMVELSKNSYSGSTRTGQINHDPKKCPGQPCYYLISVYYPDSTPAIMRTSFQVSTYLATSSSISMTESYKNILPMNRYFYYVLSPGNSDGSVYLDSLTINIENLIGDAELFVSFTNVTPSVDYNDYESRTGEDFESITIKKEGNYTLARPIYISVYANVASFYELTFVPVYSISYQIKLTRATPLYEGVPRYNYFTTEKQESFYSFLPWWAGYENRTMVFFAQAIFNNIFFYMQVNDFPNFYLTDWQDKDDVIAVNPWDPGYGLSNGYFLRARPDFALYDLISQRQYIFNMYAISQVQNTQYIDLHPNVEILGYANSSSVFYRHYLIDRYALYNITVVPIIGNPALLLKISNTPVEPTSMNVDTWDIKQDQSGKGTETITINYDERFNLEYQCLNSGYFYNGGTKYCTIYATVECSSQCVYKIIISINGTYNLTGKNLPIYVTDEIYTTGSVGFNEYKYYYIPVTKTQGEMLIYMNKTAPVGSNGDSMIVLRFMNDTVDKKLDNWTYPKLSSYNTQSSNLDSDSPEIIELCSKVFTEQCGNTSCILMIGVLGLSKNMTSNYRLIYFEAQKKLTDRTPIKGTLQNVGDYDYYWFSSNSSVKNANAYWEYVVAVNVETSGQDVDLFISVLDGRYPIDSDYDFYSDNQGPDDIYISSTDNIWTQNSYNKSHGVLFVVGVKALTANANYTLVMIGPNTLNTNFQTMTPGVQYQRSLSITNNTHYFKWFNWGFKDFRVNLDASVGQVLAYMNFVGEETYQNNGYLAIPMSSNNSKWNVFLNTTQSTIYRVYKDDYYGSTTSSFCYYCYYYFMITTNLTSQSSTYRISVNSIPDVGEEVPVLALNTNYLITLPATGTVTQRKFIMDSKDSFSITGTVTSGYANMYIGLYPNAAQSRFSWKTEGGTSSKMSISVKQTDQSFHVGAYYYLTLQAVSGKTVVTVSINQQRTVLKLESGLTYKQAFYNAEERIKFYYFQIPYRVYSRININLTSYTEDFYPTIYLYKNMLSSDRSDPTTLTYPSVNSYNQSFGDNFTAIAQKNNFTYSFKDWGNTTYTYFTMAVYSWSYGLTDRRKPEFKISVNVDTISVADANPMAEIEPIEEKEMEETSSNSLLERITSWVKGKYISSEKKIEKIFIQ